MYAYENKKTIIILSFILLLFELLTIIYFIKEKSFRYMKYTGVVVNNNEIVLLVTKEDKKNLYKNKNAYVNDRITNYEIIEDKGFLLKRDNMKYDEIIIKIKTTNKKVNDTISFSIKSHKDSWIRLLNIIGEGDENDKVR